MILLNAILFLCVQCALGLNKEGDPCPVDGVPGTCKNILDCEYAHQLIANYKKPTECSWKGNTRYVCCPLDGRAPPTGVLERFFIGASQGILRSDSMNCRYNGELPIVCCQNYPDVPVAPEPHTCPALQLPAVRGNDIVFQKCLEYQRYVNACVSSDANPNAYMREDKCYIQDFVDRISGGVPAEAKEFPHMALLGCRNTVNTNVAKVQWVAGGSLISERFILTAGHVLSHADYGLLQYALLGALTKSEARDGFLYNIIRFIPHKMYVKTQKHDDIALLELDRRVEFSDFIRPACLPSPSMTLKPYRVVAGWGQLGETKKASNDLQKVYISEFDYETDCKNRLHKDYISVFNKETMLCAGGDPNDDSDTCHGDSGGPLMAVSSNVHCSYVVRGVVSFGPSCGTGAPGIYTNVEKYMDWIQATVWPRNTK